MLNKKESGSATILAFGLTIMIMSLAISFLYTSLVGKKASYNYLDTVSARMAAQTALERAIASVREAKENPLSYSDLNPKNKLSIHENERSELINLLATSYNGIVYISPETAEKIVKSSESDSGITWIYQSSNTGDSEHYINRMSYAIIGCPEYTPDAQRVEYPDAYYYNPDSDTPKITDYRSNLYQRFNLARTNWAGITVDGFMEDDIEWSSDASASNTIRYLREFDDDKGTFPDIESRRKQIIANLIDYCDTDRIATTDNQDNPTYTGNDKTPYINEVRFVFEGRIHHFVLFDIPRSFYIFRIRNIDIELVNMYETGSMPTNAKVMCNYNYKIGSEPLQTGNISENILITAGDKGYFTGSHYSNVGDFIIIGPKDETPQGITGVKINDLEVKLTNPAETEFYDFSFIVKDNQILHNLLEADVAGGSQLYFDFEVNDPRQNLWEGDWTDTFSLNDEIGTIGDKNSVCVLPILGSETNRDTEIESEPWEISTAHISNSPMEEIFELGYIHRGAAWQTLNLKSFNAENDYTYNKGDARILDQVKIGSANERLITANLNTRDREKLEELFTLEPYTTPDTLRELSDIMLEELPPALLLSRAEIMKNPETAKFLTTKMVDGQEEVDKYMEVFSGALNNAEALPYERFYVIAIGQAFKDVGGRQGANFGEYDEYDKILATQKIIAEVIKNSGDEKNPYKITRIRYIEE